jgi:hypothetical protein
MEEAAQKVERWLEEWNEGVASQMSKSAERFSYERFRDEIDRMIKQV